MGNSILVIDDDENVRKSFLLALENTEYHVDLAESGERGIEMTGEREYDLIYLDLKMPGLNGVETLREIRKTNGDVPIHIITSLYREFFDELKSTNEEEMDSEVLRKAIESEREIGKSDKDVPVYIITAFYEEYFEQLKSLEEEGIDFEILRKPVGAEEIVLVTKSILEGPIGH